MARPDEWYFESGSNTRITFDPPATLYVEWLKGDSSNSDRVDRVDEYLISEGVLVVTFKTDRGKECVSYGEGKWCRVSTQQALAHSGWSPA